MRERRFRLLYAGLLLARLLVALLSPAYIHPDEYFQYGEVLGGDWSGKGYGTLRTWEFNPDYPCRSMASIKLFGWPLYTLALISRWRDQHASATQLLYAQRATFFALSLLLDVSLVEMLRDQDRQVKQGALLLLACSASVWTIGMRPFSNNVEASLLALCLVLVVRLRRRPSLISAIFLGAVIAVGFFSRFTFAILAFPLGIAYLQTCLAGGRSYAQGMVAAVNAFGIVSVLHIAYDTLYFASRRDHDATKIVVAPVNAALYNLKSSNLAEHGLHPYWLHAVVNAPMILGVGPYLMCLLACCNFTKGDRSMCKREAAQRGTTLATGFVPKLCLSTIIISIAILSVQPHQEPRFLMPLIVPASIVATSSQTILRSKRFLQALAVLTTLQYFGLLLLFGVAHQGGIVPAMTAFEARIHNNQDIFAHANVELYFWRSFMPPRHLILPSQNAGCASINVTVFDVGSTSAGHLATRLGGSNAHPGTSERYLFAPEWAYADPAFHKVLDMTGSRLRLESRHSPHVDMDHLGESIELMTKHRMSPRQAFSYGVWRLQK